MTSLFGTIRRTIAFTLFSAGCLHPGSIYAADQVAYGPPPSWVRETPAPVAPSESSQAATRIILQDYQLGFSKDATETYVHAMVRVQTPQGLTAIGTLALPWKPDSDTLTVHRVHILRGTQVINVLSDGQGFTVLRRENNLEYAALDGVLTATLQPSGLHVGDTIDLAYSLKRVDPVLAGVVEQLLGGWDALTLDHLRIRAQWPTAMSVRWKSSEALGTPKESHRGDLTELTLALDHLEPLAQPEGAPLRFRRLRQIEFSEYKSWSEISGRLAPLYAKAAALTPNSAFLAEIAKIKNRSEDPVVRAQDALILVQDQVRYVYLGMNDGAIVPAPADTTWIRRFGDCKAKTALLLAALSGLGIDAEPVAVNTIWGDGLDARLPMVAAFDHVLVRAQIGGQTYWLDGTRTGDRRLSTLPVPAYRWGLPLTQQGAELVQINPRPLELPLSSTSIRIDATSGIHAPAPFHADIRLGGDGANIMRFTLGNLSATDLDRALRAFWSKQYDFVDPTSVAATFDEHTGSEDLVLDGIAHLDWDGRRYETDGLGVGYNADFKRQETANHDAPFAVAFPVYSKVHETILLPHPATTFSVEGKDVDQTVAGVEYHRHARIENEVFEAESSTRSIAPEFPYADAASAQKTLREMSKDTLYVRVSDAYWNTEKDVAATVAKTPESADEYVTRCNAFLDKGDYQGAIADCDKAIALDQKDAMAFADRGLANVWLQRYDLAQSDFASALSLDPRNAVAYRGRGVIEMKSHHYPKAIEAFSKALDLQPNSLFALLRRADSYLAIGADDKALEDFSQAIKIRPDTVMAYAEKATILIHQGKTTDASSVANELLSANPDSVPAQNAARRIHEAVKQAEAVDLLKQKGQSSKP